MRAFVAVTDTEWYRFLSASPHLDEVNFWQPGGSQEFKALEKGEPFIVKLRFPENAIVGGDFFTHFTQLPVSLAWQAFGEKNGTATFAEMRERIERLRRAPPSREDYVIGCVILQDPFFFDRSEWVPAPPDFHPNIVRGKSYDLATSAGRALWDQVVARRSTASGAVGEPRRPVYGEPALVTPRLGQGTFRVLVTDVYGRRCAVTREKALPVLEAAHIRPVREGGAHRIDNGILLRSDVHTLFDRGYVTVTPDYQLQVSSRLKRDFDNGELYYQFNGERVWVPPAPDVKPAREYLQWHEDTVFLR